MDSQSLEGIIASKSLDEIDLLSSREARKIGNNWHD